MGTLASFAWGNMLQSLAKKRWHSRTKVNTWIQVSFRVASPAPALRASEEERCRFPHFSHRLAVDRQRRVRLWYILRGRQKASRGAEWWSLTFLLFWGVRGEPAPPCFKASLPYPRGFVLRETAVSDLEVGSYFHAQEFFRNHVSRRQKPVHSLSSETRHNMWESAQINSLFKTEAGQRYIPSEECGFPEWGACQRGDLNPLHGVFVLWPTVWLLFPPLTCL